MIWGWIDSTIAPPKTSGFLQRKFNGSSTQRRILLNKRVSIYMYTFVCKCLTIDDVEVSRDTGFQDIRPGAGFETGDFVNEKLGGLP